MDLIPWFPFEDFTRMLPPMRVSIPEVDVSETKDKVVVKARIGDIPKENLEVKVSQNQIVIKGKKEETKEIKKAGYYCKEATFGSFYRSFPLPAAVESDKAKMTYRAGVLTITIPKKEKLTEIAKKIAKRIKVKAATAKKKTTKKKTTKKKKTTSKKKTSKKSSKKK